MGKRGRVDLLAMSHSGNERTSAAEAALQTMLYRSAGRVCVSTRVVPTGLAVSFHSSRHLRAGLSHSAASRLEFGGSYSTAPQK
jgi:hypothetical protein